MPKSSFKRLGFNPTLARLVTGNCLGQALSERYFTYSVNVVQAQIAYTAAINVMMYTYMSASSATPRNDVFRQALDYVDS